VNSARNPLLEAALGYAQRGWPVLPCKPRGKVPLTEHGCKDATLSIDTIVDWWARWPAANVGIATGEVSGLLVLDVVPDGGDALPTSSAGTRPCRPRSAW
jgi:hypothetical protein